MDTNSRRHVLGNQLDIEQILLEAQHRWLRPAEICEILQNYKSFRICPEPADKPPSGSLFLFDRKVLRYFRKDGHNWRKKKDGKTVKEAHERLKSGSVDVLHCYYAHGEDNENFQRRSYWMLEEALSHIVLVHYRDVKGNRTNISRTRENVEASHSTHEAGNNLSESEMSNSVSSSMQRSTYQNPSPTTDSTSLSSMHASQYEDAESAYNDQNNHGLHPFLEACQPVNGSAFRSSSTYYSVSNDYQDKMSNFGGVDITSLTQVGTCEDGPNQVYERPKHNDLPSWEDMLKNYTGEIPYTPFESSLLSARSDNMGIIFKQEPHMAGQLMGDGYSKKQEILSDVQAPDEWRTSDGFSSDLSNWPLDTKFNSNSYGQEIGSLNLPVSTEASHSYPTEQCDVPPKSEPRATKLDSELYPDGRAVMKQSFLQGHVNEDGLKKLDSFNRWMSKELGDVDESIVQSRSGAYWGAVESENEINDSGGPSQVILEADMVGPSLSMDQLFSIIDFSPSWAYEDSEIKVLITGRFLRGQSELEKLKWSCMFGEIEVPAEVIADGVLRCLAPRHKYGRVPFYITCSNRFACSEVREFEYRALPVQEMDHNEHEDILRMRFVKLLSLDDVHPLDDDSKSSFENSNLSGKFNELMNGDDDDEWDQMLKTTPSETISSEKMKDQLTQKLLKEKLHVWLLHKAAEGGKGANLLDDDGQGVLHIAAALGYGWAIPPTILAGVNINFRDVNGWTALHWAAFCGRERTVVSLISLGAAAGALTDPTPKYPSGRTAADLAATNGHKGIAGYLAETALSAHLSSLDLKDSREGDAVDVSGVKAVQAVAERDPNPVTDLHIPYGVSLKDSLTAVSNATQAAARIHQVFRAQSFQRKQIQEYKDENQSSNEAALSCIALKQPNAFHGGPAAAATRIQNKFRSYKGRKQFLIIRESVVKLQAHVRGHQVRKKYVNIIWSVGILEKVVLRWRRKGSGLRGFKPEGQIEGPSSITSSSNEDDDDFLKKGRKQTEERLQKALARVKSMVQYPEARDQYRRLLNVVSEIQETKVVYDRALNNMTDDMADFDNDLIDLEALFEADEMDSLMTAES